MAESIEAMEYRYNKMIRNPKNMLGHGILRKLYYQIVQAKEKAARS